MEERMEVRRFLLFLTVTVLPAVASAVSHSLQYFSTSVSPGIKCPELVAEGRVDGEQFEYYDSDIKTFIPKTDWMKHAYGEDAEYWNEETQEFIYYHETYKVSVSNLMQLYNQSSGLHTMQVIYGCELNDGKKSGFWQMSYDGADFLSLDQKTFTWSAATPQAEIIKEMWEKNLEEDDLKICLETECINRVQQLVIYGKSSLERKVHPEVSLFQKNSFSPVVCHATGFFPRAVMISWQKDGEDLHEDVELRETVPNNDGTFQKRSLLTVPPEELKRNQYTCVVQHSRLEEDLVLPVDDRRILSGEVPVRVIAGAVVAVLLLFFPGVILWKKKTCCNSPSLQTITSAGSSSPVLQEPTSSDSSSLSLQGRDSPGSSSPALQEQTSPASEGDEVQVTAC